MGMIKRQVVLLALSGVGGAALLMDRTMLHQAAGAAGTFTGMVEQVKAAQSIAQTLDSGDPAAIQNLLENLVEKEDADPDSVQAGLFGSGSAGGSAASGLGGLAGLFQPDQTASEQNEHPASGGDRVSMIIATAGGGLAVVNGKPMRVGQTIDGIRLVKVRPDHVVIERGGSNKTLSLR